MSQRLEISTTYFFLANELLFRVHLPTYKPETQRVIKKIEKLPKRNPFSSPPSLNKLSQTSNFCHHFFHTLLVKKNGF